MKELFALIVLLGLTGCLNKNSPNRSKVYHGSHSQLTNLCNPTNIAKKNNSNEAIPCQITPPRYPRKAAEKRIEGHVAFNFTVNKNGYPSNIKITESIPEGVFDKVAIKALKEWRFLPEFENGLAVAQNNKSYIVEFKIEQ
ncbi:MAG: energy transducer TonB [Kangiellaceae bacterium]|nr:energy transducer TonB [Kangiellaceae bacterium]MCW9016603.1 energy transducer TonB [Kangiellaceae bacterium]